MPSVPPMVAELMHTATTDEEKLLIANLENSRRKCVELAAIYTQSIALESTRNALASRKQYHAQRTEFAKAIAALLDSVGTKPISTLRINCYDSTPHVEAGMSDKAKWDVAAKLTGTQRTTYLRKAFPEKSYS